MKQTLIFSSYYFYFYMPRIIILRCCLSYGAPFVSKMKKSRYYIKYMPSIVKYTILYKVNGYYNIKYAIL